MQAARRSAGRARSAGGLALLGGLLLAVAGVLSACERTRPPEGGGAPATAPAAATRAAAAATTSPGAGSAARAPFTLARGPGADVRLLCYNVEWNSIFQDVDPARAARFARVVAAVAPDVLALQEIGVHPGERGASQPRKRTAAEVAALLDRVLPLADGARWQAFQGHSNVIASRWPLGLTAERTVPEGERELALALVDLPDERFAADLYVINNHSKCCGGEANDPPRQQQSDAIMAWVRDLRTPGGELDLPEGTPIVIAGDLNLVGGPGPLTTLLAGDIADEARYGPDFAPDWDGTGLADAHPRHNGTEPEDYTWRDDTDRWAPGRLDFVLYSDSVLEVVRALVLNTTLLSEAELRAAGLEKLDVAADDAGKRLDHLPLVVDFRL